MRSCSRGAERERDRHAVVDQVAVREQHALGRAGGARGVLDVGDVAGVRRCLDEIRPPASMASQESSPSQMTCSSGKRLAVARLVQNLPVVGARIVLAKEQGADAGLLQNVAEFVRAVRGIDVDQDNAGAGGGVLHQDPFDAVAGPDAGAVAGPKSEARESSGDAGDFPIQLLPREPHILMADDQAVARRKPRGGASQRLG